MDLQQGTNSVSYSQIGLLTMTTNYTALGNREMFYRYINPFPIPQNI
jgi:hypothetical protein